jgi:hypothetical protein
MHIRPYLLVGPQNTGIVTCLLGYWQAIKTTLVWVHNPLNQALSNMVAINLVK